MIVAKCKHLTSNAPQDDQPLDGSEEFSARVPWSGSTLGLSDLLTLTSRSRSILVGVMGAHDAGKTTLLLGNYLNCLRGERLANADFAGSWTLGAWEALAAWSRFHDATTQPHFPPHTPRSTDRSPGLLHLALRRPNEKTRDVLLTDAPGEWFASWSIKQHAKEAEGAQWIADQSDAFMIIADCERLSGDKRGSTRSELRQLIERLGPMVCGRPVVLVWAKSDITSPGELKPAIRESILRALHEQIPHAIEVSSTARKPSSLNEALNSVLIPSWHPKPAKAVTEPVLNHQPFSAFRGFHAES